MTSRERLADARCRTAQALAGSAPGLSQDHFERPCLVLAFTASRAGLVVAVPVPVAAAARAAEVDLLSAAGSAAGRFAELLGVEVTEQLSGPVVAAHGDHHFSAPLLGQGVEAAH